MCCNFESFGNGHHRVFCLAVGKMAGLLSCMRVVAFDGVMVFVGVAVIAVIAVIAVVAVVVGFEAWVDIFLALYPSALVGIVIFDVACSLVQCAVVAVAVEFVAVLVAVLAFVLVAVLLVVVVLVTVVVLVVARFVVFACPYF